MYASVGNAILLEERYDVVVSKSDCRSIDRQRSEIFELNEASLVNCESAKSFMVK